MAADPIVRQAKDLIGAQQFDRAIQLLCGALVQEPRNSDLQVLLGSCLFLVGELERARKCFADVITYYGGKGSNVFAARFQSALICHRLSRYEEALSHYRFIQNNMLGIGHDDESLHGGFVDVLIDLGKFAEAREYLQKHCSSSARPETLTRAAHLAMGFGDWFRCRSMFALANPNSWPGIVPPPAQSLADVRGKSVLILCEGGFGDVLHFIRYVIPLCEIASAVTILTKPVLKRLLATMRLSKPLRVVTSLEEARGCGASIPSLDLLYLFGSTPENVPAFDRYFYPPAGLIAERQLPPSGGRLRVGVLWAGSAHETVVCRSIDQRRSIQFELLEPVLALAACLPIEFVSLQLPEQHRPHPHLTQVLQANFDFLDTAAIVQHLDLIIAVDSAVAHLAGALGRPVWLLNRFDGCWRWLWNDSTTTPWYARMRIFRQERHNEWPEVIERVAEELAATAAAQAYGLERRRSSSSISAIMLRA